MAAKGYQRAMADRYDSDWEGIAMSRRDAEFYLQQALLTTGEVCEVGAGTGRCLLPIARAFAERGLERRIHAVEPSPHMRAQLEAALEDEPPSVRELVTVHEGHFCEIPLADASLGLVFSAFRSFQHLEDVDAQLGGLAEAWRTLRRGGRLSIDLFEPRFDLLCDEEPVLAARYGDEEGNVVERWDERHHDRGAQVVEVRMRWLERDPDDERRVLREESASYRVRYLFRYELIHLLARAGIHAFELLGDFDGSPLSSEPRELIVVADKP